MILSRALVAPACRRLFSHRSVSTLSSNPSIKAFPNAAPNSGYLLSYLNTIPPTSRLAIGACTQLPPTPQEFTENHEFLSILNDVLRRNAAQDPNLQSQAQAFAGPGQGGAGGAGVGGHVHLSDLRNPPDYGRIAFPEDILGSIEVDGHGKIIGKFEPSGTYRIVTNEGILGLSEFLQAKLIERLEEEEKSD
ncbi:putative poly [ADP-ribose] polymerase 6 [Rosellinia necatrix]|uniref:Putative poly [ADP-ribose] polymerase 6 n=1 Tax=Rosellinia necatrix TaxID=77044 RepID=A0A1W2TME6_ROSNE|nr:putative poly [ADP-ribose] polymerase 6 [Rosellinia necatrix]